MTGLEKIIGQIEEDTASNISDILVSADQKAEKIEILFDFLLKWQLDSSIFVPEIISIKQVFIPEMKVQ